MIFHGAFCFGAVWGRPFLAWFVVIVKRIAKKYVLSARRSKKANNEKALSGVNLTGLLNFGASTRNRTGTNFRSRDFKSLASTYSAMDAASCWCGWRKR